MYITVLSIIISSITFQTSLQNCPEEISIDGISVKWPKTEEANNIESDPLCYRNDTLITRNCSNTKWIPSLNETGPCLKVVKYFDVSTCPPGSHKISKTDSNYCYQTDGHSAWNIPCFTSGGASVITDLSDGEVKNLIESLKALNTSRYFWLPAQRQQLFSPVVWYTPGPNWGKNVIAGNSLKLYTTLFKNCLILDIEEKTLMTDTCSKSYPSLCFYLSDLHNPVKCPTGYNSFRFLSENGTCFGIERSDKGLSYNDFVQTKCNRPMTHSKFELSRFLFKKIANFSELPNDQWCWFGLPYSVENSTYSTIQQENNKNHTKQNPEVLTIQGIINNEGSVSLLHSEALLHCMACETDLIYSKTELMFEYNDVQNKMYLTVYYPSGLWKYNINDKGIQCFSDAKGFVRVINVDDVPIMDLRYVQREEEDDLGNIEKIVYVIDLITDSSAQYWCEGHTVNFSLIATDKIIVNPKGNRIHVFSLVIKYYVSENNFHSMDNLTELVNNITDIFGARQVLLMEILNYVCDHMMILLHLHVDIDNIYESKAQNIQSTFVKLREIADIEFEKYNFTFINMSSSVYCLPTISNDTAILEWEMTQIGRISAPKQFCLQSNGLPVKRRCDGSYKLGSMWGEVDGYCDGNYEASETTEFLYTFVNRQMPDNESSRFLTAGLNFVLGDTDIIIPADIYYLSMSLQQISDQVQEHNTSIDTGDIDNIAWIMDRVMVLDCNYLRLAQTLNSTNVILDSVSDIIEIIAEKKSNGSSEVKEDAYQLSVKSQFVIQVTYPELNNVTGIAITRNTFSDNFTNMSIHKLYRNTTLDDVLSLKNLEIATWLPSEVLDTLTVNFNYSAENLTTTDNLHVIITIYHNDAVFQELTTNKHVLNSRIVGISIPGYLSNLQYPVPLVFKQLNNKPFATFCGYWDFHPQQIEQTPGLWKKQGCFKVKSVGMLTVCECYHLTHFGQLLDISNAIANIDDPVNSSHVMALNVITLVGSFLSLLGIFGIWITALVFGNWRKKAGTKVLLQLSTAIALPLIFIVIFNLDNTIFVFIDGRYVLVENMKSLCIILGASLHFSILASFMWMLITAVLQFIRYVRVLGVRRPSRFMIKFTLVGWGIPLIPVIIVLAINAENYIPGSSMMKKICYPNGYFFIGTVLLPICIILLINIILFIMVLHAISRGPDQKMKTPDIDLVGAQLRVSIFLIFLLGLTWIFGILSFSHHLIWSYLFCLTSTLQGFVLFIYFVICDPTTRNLWITLMKPQFTSSTNSSRNSVTSLSSGPF